jgi:uncharacterized protein DUF2799
MTRRLAFFLLSVALAACATLDQPTSANLAQYCTPENAYRLGSQSRAYFGVCPKETEARFLQGLARGRAIRPSTPVVEPYYRDIAQTEQRLLAASSEAEREPLRARLRDLEWWAIHLLYNNGTYMP